MQLGTSTVEKAQENQVFIVSDAWVNDCITQQRRVDESSYFIGDRQVKQFFTYL